MATGVIKKLVMDRGFGFIAPEGGGADIFFHCSALPQKCDFDALEEGLTVTYEIGDGKNGRPKAENVQVVS